MLDKKLRFLPGKGYGLCEKVLIAHVAVNLLESSSWKDLDNLLSDFFFLSSTDPNPVEDMTCWILRRVHDLYTSVQREANVAVFGPCHIGLEFNSNGWKVRTLLLPYAHQAASIAALQWSISTINTLLNSVNLNRHDMDSTKARRAELIKSLSQYAVPGTNIFHFIEAAHGRQIEYQELPGGLFAYGLGCNSIFLKSTISDHTSAISTGLARDKFNCCRILELHGLPIPKQAMVDNADSAVRIAEKIGYPVVIKPSDQDQGRGVFTGLRSTAAVREYFSRAARFSERILIEEHVNGDDYRLTVLRGKVIKVMRRRPGGVTGDGIRTVSELLAEEQLKPDHQAALRRTGKMRLSLDEEAISILQEAGLASDSVPDAGQFVVLRRQSNVSTGGSHFVVPLAEVHPDNLALAIDAACAIRLDIAGIDLLITDVSRSWREVRGVICEVNAQPQIGYRDTPEIFTVILEELLPKGEPFPLHLFICEHHPKASGELLAMAKKLGANALSCGSDAFLNGIRSGQFRDGFHSAKALLLDRRCTGATLFMTHHEIACFGLPAARFTSIRLINSTGLPNGRLEAATWQLVTSHSKDIKFMSFAEANLPVIST